MIHTCKVQTTSFQKIHQDEQYQRIRNKIEANSRHHTFQRMYQELSPDYTVSTEVKSDIFTLPCKRNMAGLFVIPIQIHHKTLRFVIDTGAQVSGIRETIAKQLGLKKSKGNLKVGSISGTEKELNGYLVEQLEFGKIIYHHYPMIALNDQDFCIPHTKIPFTRMDGIIGWDILHQFDFEIDTISHKFKVMKNLYRFPFQNLITGNFPVIIATDQKKQYYFGIDTGATMGWVSTQAISQHGLEVLGTMQTLGVGVHGLEKMDATFIKKLTLQIDRAQITLTGVMSGRCDMYQGITLDGVFGNEIFAGRRIRFLNSAQVVLLV